MSVAEKINSDADADEQERHEDFFCHDNNLIKESELC